MRPQRRSARVTGMDDVRFEPLSDAIAQLASAVGEGFARVDSRFDRLDDRLSRLEVRVEDGFAILDCRLSRLEGPRRR